MFKSLKEKLKKVISSIGKKAEKEAVEEEKKVEEVKEEIKEKVEKEIKIEVKEEKPKEKPLEKETEEKVEQPLLKKDVDEKIKIEVKKEEKRLGIFGKIKEKVITKKISEDKFEDLFEELELILLENNVAFEVVEKLKEDLKKDLVDKPIIRKDFEGLIERSLKESIEGLFVEGYDILSKVKEKKPYVIVFVGVNGSGKTTTLAKVAKMLIDNKKTCVLAAADTFRAASVEQLNEWAKKLKVPIVKGQYGADPASVAFDGVKMAEARNLDVVLIDTAGRLHNNKDLLREMQKIVRVSKPDLKIFIGESITGNDCIEQVKEFDNAIDIDGVILTKSDVDEKGGAMISVSYVTGKPIIYLGTGQSAKDLKPFNKQEILKGLGL